MTIVASRHYAMPLPWIIVLMVVLGLFTLWLVVWAIPKFLTGKGFDRHQRLPPLWKRNKKESQ